ncbi:uncharacterized protein LOC131086477 [Melospiza georgiana]|uniref:uncharacterized protein LOC131086477 n=1 Tax=Melospiza georgiana TaxID=44398 RepID=UPI0025ACCD89|nr:uncharacterized protein LOC131086477 [Melospiza georgiana]
MGRAAGAAFGSFHSGGGTRSPARGWHRTPGQAHSENACRNSLLRVPEGASKELRFSTSFNRVGPFSLARFLHQPECPRSVSAQRHQPECPRSPAGVGAAAEERRFHSPAVPAPGARRGGGGARRRLQTSSLLLSPTRRCPSLLSCTHIGQNGQKLLPHRLCAEAPARVPPAPDRRAAPAAVPAESQEIKELSGNFSDSSCPALLCRSTLSLPVPVRAVVTVPRSFPAC